MGPRVVILDDDETLREVLRSALADEGFEIILLSSGSEVMERLALSLPDVLVLSSSPPGLNGIDICRRLRTEPATMRMPVVLLVPAGKEGDRLTGLAAGADDCLVKPVSSVELAIRVKNLLRRMNPNLLGHMIRVGDLTLDREAHRVHRQKKEVKLGPTEFRLLEFLMRSPGRVYSRTELKISLWGDGATVDERAVDVHIGRLRKGISLGKADRVIRTVRGAGYALGDF